MTILPVSPTEAAVNPGNGTKKSSALTAVPLGVAILICPDPVPAGTSVLTDVLVAADKLPSAMLLNLTRSLPGEESKFVPVIVTAAPAAPICGENPEMVGAELCATIVKFFVEVAVPAGVVTVIGPVVAPVGTAVVICVDVDEVTRAVMPLKETVFCDGVVLNPVPVIVTEDPSSPRSGVKEITETCDDM